VSLAGAIVLFGGSVVYGAPCGAETWTWNGTAWAELTASGPSGRCDAMMTALNGQIVLFGGSPGQGSLADTWTWTWGGTTWTEQPVSGPSKRSEGVMATW